MKVNHLETIKRLLDEIKDKDRVIEEQHNVILDLRAKVYHLEIPRLGIYVENMKGDQFYCPHCKMDAFCTNPDCTSNHFEKRTGLSQDEIDVLLAVITGETQPQAQVVDHYEHACLTCGKLVCYEHPEQFPQAPVVEVSANGPRFIRGAIADLKEALTVDDKKHFEKNIRSALARLDDESVHALLQSKGGR